MNKKRVFTSTLFLLLTLGSIASASRADSTITGYYTSFQTDTAEGRIYRCELFVNSKPVSQTEAPFILDRKGMSEADQAIVRRSTKEHPVSLSVTIGSSSTSLCGEGVIIHGLAIVPNKEKQVPTNDSSILFEAKEGWGPCPPDGICTQKTTLYSSGKLLLSGEKNGQSKLSSAQLTRFKRTVTLSGVLTKPCPSQMVLDYQVTYNINLNNKKRTLRFPSCEKELTALLNELKSIMK